MSAATPYLLPAEMTIAHAAQVREALLQALSLGHTQFDAHAVVSIDSAGVQLLLAMRRSVQAAQAALILTAPSAVLMDALRLYGLGELVQPTH